VAFCPSLTRGLALSALGKLDYGFIKSKNLNTT
jgi:hypothetical protein